MYVHRPFSQKVWAENWNFLYCDSHYSCPIRSQICSCHNSKIAILFSNYISSKTNMIFARLHYELIKLFVKWPPGLNGLTITVNRLSDLGHYWFMTGWQSEGKPLTHWGRDKMDAIFQTTFSSEFSWMKMYKFRLRFLWNLFLGFELTIFHHWFR